MEKSSRRIIISSTVVVVVIVAVAAAFFAFQQAELNRTVDAYAVQYSVTGLTGAENITVGQAPRSNRSGPTETASVESRSGSLISDVVVGAGEQAFVTIAGTDVGAVTCSIIRDADRDAIVLDAVVDRTPTSVTCGFTMPTGERVF